MGLAVSDFLFLERMKFQERVLLTSVVDKEFVDFVKRRQVDDIVQGYGA
jgi:hypothetical protein